MFQVRLNKLSLAATQQPAAVTQVVDKATRAMVAVFLSNLLFGLPHAIAHLEPFDDRVSYYVSIHSFFFTHLFVDPLVFLCFNEHHRRRVLQTLQLWISNSRQVVSTVMAQVTQ